MHKIIKPKVLYFGTPVVLLSSLNKDGSSNLAPISSVWWLGSHCMIGMSNRSKTVQNLIKHGECVINLPSPAQVANVNKLALLTGSDPIPDYKLKMGYNHESNKFGAADLTTMHSDLVKPARVFECPIQLEAIVKEIHEFGNKEDHISAIQLEIVRVHAEEEYLVTGKENYIDPDKWSPLIMNFTEFYGLSPRIYESKLAEVYGPTKIISEAN